MKSRRKLLLALFATLAIFTAALSLLLARQGRQPEFLGDHERRMDIRIIDDPWEAFVVRGEIKKLMDEGSEKLLPNPAWMRGTYGSHPDYFSNADDGREIWITSAKEFLELASYPYVVVSEQDLAFLEERNNSEYVVVLVYGAKPLERMKFRLRKLGILRELSITSLPP